MNNKIDSNILKYAEHICDHIVKNDIKNVLLLDRAARPIAYAIRYAFKNKNISYKYNTYFINPEYYNWHPDEEEFKSNYKKLYADREEKAIIIDNCMHKWYSMIWIFAFLKNLSFNNLSVGILSAENVDILAKKEFNPIFFNKINWKEQKIWCKACWTKSWLNKWYYNMFVSVSSQKEVRELRKEIKELFKNQ